MTKLVRTYLSGGALALFTNLAALAVVMTILSLQKVHKVGTGSGSRRLALRHGRDPGGAPRSGAKGCGVS